MLRVSWREKKRNEWIRETIGVPEKEVLLEMINVHQDEEAGDEEMEKRNAKCKDNGCQGKRLRLSIGRHIRAKFQVHCLLNVFIAH